MQYPIIIDTLTSFEKKFHIKATQEDLDYLTDLLIVPAVKSFTAEIMLKLNRKEHKLDVWGKVDADLELQSVISLDNFRKKHHTEFKLVFDTKMTYKEQKALIEEDAENVPDIVENGQIDLVDIAVEQIALVMDDHPRKEGEKFEFNKEFDDLEPKRQNPFEVLAKLKK